MMSVEHTDLHHPRGQRWSVFIPLLILIVTYVATTAFQTAQLVRERSTFDTVHLNQEKALQNAKKIRENTEKLGRDIKSLADSGNKNAKLVEADLRARGITINPQAPSPTGEPGLATPAVPSQ
jgi:hypothetical protein